MLQWVAEVGDVCLNLALLGPTITSLSSSAVRIAGLYMARCQVHWMVRRHSITAYGATIF